MCVDTRVVLCLAVMWVMFYGWDGNLYLSPIEPSSFYSPSKHVYWARVPDAGLFHGSPQSDTVFPDFGWFCHSPHRVPMSSSSSARSFFLSLHVCDGTPSTFRPPLLKFVVPAQAGIYEYKPLPLEASLLFVSYLLFPFSQSWASWSARAVWHLKAESAPTTPSAQIISDISFSILLPC